MSGPGRKIGTSRLLELDPDLADGLPPARLGEAVAAGAVDIQYVPKGDWQPTAPTPGTEGFGLLILSGFMVRRVGRGGWCGAELLGRGDLLRPWQTPGLTSTQPFESSWQAISATSLARLDHDFAARVAPFPEIATRIVDRAMLRSRHLAFELAILQQRRVEDRLRTLFWLLADRWGYVTSEAVRLEAPLTHALLAELVAARRPSVTTALGQLAEAGEITRDAGEWVLPTPASG
jgi:CRP-like cAMP-binding protein